MLSWHQQKGLQQHDNSLQILLKSKKKEISPDLFVAWRIILFNDNLIDNSTNDMHSLKL